MPESAVVVRKRLVRVDTAMPEIFRYLNTIITSFRTISLTRSRMLLIAPTDRPYRRVCILQNIVPSERILFIPQFSVKSEIKKKCKNSEIKKISRWDMARTLSRRIHNPSLITSVSSYRVRMTYLNKIAVSVKTAILFWWTLTDSNR